MEPRQIFGFGFEHCSATGAIAERFEVLSDAGTIRVVDPPLRGLHGHAMSSPEWMATVGPRVR